MHPQKVKRDRLPLAELLDNVQTPKKSSAAAQDKAAATAVAAGGEGVGGVVYRSTGRGHSATLERPSKSQVRKRSSSSPIVFMLSDRS